jgi:hypothetical protein
MTKIKDRLEDVAYGVIEKVPRDKLMHMGMGVATVVGAAVICIVARYNFGFAMAIATTLVGIAYEAQQKYRGEGEPSWADAAATSAPGFVVWGGLEVFQRWM